MQNLILQLQVALSLFSRGFTPWKLRKKKFIGKMGVSVLLVVFGCTVFVVCNLFYQNNGILVLNCWDKIYFIWLVYILGTLYLILNFIPLLLSDMEEAVAMVQMKRKKKLHGNHHISISLMLIEYIFLFSNSSGKNLQFIWFGYPLVLIAGRDIHIFLIFEVFTKTTFLRNFNTNHYGLGPSMDIFFFYILLLWFL